MDEPTDVILKFHPHPFTFLGFYFSAFIFTVVGFSFENIFGIMGIFSFILAEVSRRAETFYILKAGVERKYHFLSTSKKFIEYSKIQDVEVNQSFIENIFGIGSIKFNTAGSSHVELSFYGAKNPYAMEKTIREKLIAL